MWMGSLTGDPAIRAEPACSTADGRFSIQRSWPHRYPPVETDVKEAKDKMTRMESRLVQLDDHVRQLVGEASEAAK